jgi:hypothetical protein
MTIVSAPRRKFCNGGDDEAPHRERSLAAEPLAAGVALVGDPQLQRRNLKE